MHDWCQAVFHGPLYPPLTGMGLGTILPFLDEEIVQLQICTPCHVDVSGNNAFFIAREYAKPLRQICVNCVNFRQN